VLRLAGVVISVGLADSLNPTTAAPGLYLATVPKPALRVSQFTAGVFIVNLAGGLLLTLGPGRWLLGLVPHPQRSAKHVIELVAGVIMLACAVGVWLRRRHLARRELPTPSGSGGSSLIAGATVAAVELPTAVPYLAVLAAIIGSSAGVPMEIGLIALYNVAFVLPLLAIIVVLLVAGDRAEPWLRRGQAWLQRRWPAVLATLLLLIGSCLAVLGGAGLVKQ
jgi:cytochrome c biogenesis protein CcdA